MRKLRKSITTAFLCTAMCWGMTAAAVHVLAETTVPSAEDTASVSIKNIEDAAEVTAYRVVKPSYNDYGFLQFETIEGVTITDLEAPTADEITAAAKAIINGTITPESFTLSGDNETPYTADLKAGEYIVLVKSADNAQYVYNPMLVSAYYTDACDADSLTSAAELDADSKVTGDVYAKKVEIPFDKKITNPDGDAGNDDVDDLAVGDTAKFEINTVIPSWADVYKVKGVTYTITDEQDAGFGTPEEITVMVGGDVAEESADTFTITVTGNDFTVEFTSDYALSNAGKDVTVTYQSVLTEDAVQKFEANNNTAKVEFTNSPQDKDSISYYEDNTKHYTFPVEIQKTGDDTARTPLSGAVFSIERVDEGEDHAEFKAEATTGKDGIARFNRLDEGTYQIKETKAPEGYTANPNTFEIVITAEYSEDGTLSSYNVVMTDLGNDKEAGNITVASEDDKIVAGNVVDSRIPEAPGTGDQSRRLFWGSLFVFSVTAGAAIMMKRRKEGTE